ncbi:MAG: ATP-binding cassette domain-containing protein [bacterium]
MEELQPEQRQYLRVSDVLEVEVEPIGAGNGALRKESTLDLAGGGIRLAGDAPVKPGDVIRLKLGIPGEGERGTLVCRGEVRWVQEGDAEAPGRYLYGVRFTDIPDAERDRLVKYVFSRHYGIRKQEGVAISVRNLRKNYGRIEALRGVSFEVMRGEIFALLGPNGAGKSTMTRILSTLLTPTSGSAQILCRDLMKEKQEIRRAVGYMPQAYVLYDDLTAVENLRFFGRAYGLHGRRLADLIDEALAFTELTARANDLFRTFSGGMRQRLSLACTLIHRPQILFLDEPTAGVDLKLRKSFWDYFHHLSETGVTVFVTTHQMDEVEYCQRVACIHEGRIALDDTPRNIRKLGLTRAVFVIGGERREFQVQDFDSALPGIIRELGGDAGRIESVEIYESSLEEILRDRIMGGVGVGR